jgi:hypothetical protein
MIISSVLNVSKASKSLSNVDIYTKCRSNSLNCISAFDRDVPRLDLRISVPFWSRSWIKSEVWKNQN